MPFIIRTDDIGLSTRAQPSHGNLRYTISADPAEPNSWQSPEAPQSFGMSRQIGSGLDCV